MAFNRGAKMQIWPKVIYGLLLGLKLVAEAVGRIHKCLSYFCNCLEEYLTATQTDVENLTTQTDVENLTTQTDVENLTTQTDVENLTTQTDVGNQAIQTSVEDLTTKKGVNNLKSQVGVENATRQAEVEFLTESTSVEWLTTQTDVQHLLIQTDVEPLTTQTDAENLTTQTDVENLTTQTDVENLTTQAEDVDNLTIQTDVENLTTQTDVHQLTEHGNFEHLTTKTVVEHLMIKTDVDYLTTQVDIGTLMIQNVEFLINQTDVEHLTKQGDFEYLTTHEDIGKLLRISVIDFHDDCRFILENSAMLMRIHFDVKLLNFVLFLRQEIKKYPVCNQKYLNYLKSIRNYCLTCLQSSVHSSQSFILLHMFLHRMHLSVIVIEYENIEDNFSVSTRNSLKSKKSECGELQISSASTLPKEFKVQLDEDVNYISPFKTTITKDLNNKGLAKCSIFMDADIINIPESLPENIFDSGDEDDETLSLPDQNNFSNLSSDTVPANTKVSFSYVPKTSVLDFPNPIGKKVEDVIGDLKNVSFTANCINETKEKEEETSVFSTQEGSNVKTAGDSSPNLFPPRNELKEIPVVERNLSEVKEKTSHNEVAIKPEDFLASIIKKQDEFNKSTAQKNVLSKNIPKTLPANLNVDNAKTEHVKTINEVSVRKNREGQAFKKPKITNVKVVDWPGVPQYTEFNILPDDEEEQNNEVKKSLNSTESKNYRANLKSKYSRRCKSGQTKEENVIANNLRKACGSESGSNIDSKRPGIAWFLSRRGISYDELSKHHVLQNQIPAVPGSSIKYRKLNRPTKIIIDLEDKRAISLLKLTDEPCDELLEMELLFYFAIKGEIVISASPPNWLRFTACYCSTIELQKLPTHSAMVCISIHKFVWDFCEFRLKRNIKDHYSLKFYSLPDTVSYAIGFDRKDPSVENVPEYPLQLPLPAPKLVTYYDWELPMEDEEEEVLTTTEAPRSILLATNLSEFTVSFGALPDRLQNVLKKKHPDWSEHTSVVVQFPVLTPQEIVNDNGKQLIFLNWWNYFLYKSSASSRSALEDAFANFLERESTQKKEIETENSLHKSDASILLPFQEIDLEEPLTGENVLITQHCDADFSKETKSIPFCRYERPDECSKIDINVKLFNFLKLKLQEKSVKSTNLESEDSNKFCGSQTQVVNVVESCDQSNEDPRVNEQKYEATATELKSSKKKKKRKKRKKNAPSESYGKEKEETSEISHFSFDESKKDEIKEGINKDASSTDEEKRYCSNAEINQTFHLTTMKIKNIRKVTKDTSNSKKTMLKALDEDLPTTNAVSCGGEEKRECISAENNQTYHLTTMKIEKKRKKFKGKSIVPNEQMLNSVDEEPLSITNAISCIDKGKRECVNAENKKFFLLRNINVVENKNMIKDESDNKPVYKTMEFLALPCIDEVNQECISAENFEFPLIKIKKKANGIKNKSNHNKPMLKDIFKNHLSIENTDCGRDEEKLEFIGAENNDTFTPTKIYGLRNVTEDKHNNRPVLKASDKNYLSLESAVSCKIKEKPECIIAEYKHSFSNTKTKIEDIGIVIKDKSNDKPILKAIDDELARIRNGVSCTFKENLENINAKSNQTLHTPKLKIEEIRNENKDQSNINPILKAVGEEKLSIDGAVSCTNEEKLECIGAKNNQTIPFAKTKIEEIENSTKENSTFKPMSKATDEGYLYIDKAVSCTDVEKRKCISVENNQASSLTKMKIKEKRNVIMDNSNNHKTILKNNDKKHLPLSHATMSNEQRHTFISKEVNDGDILRGLSFQEGNSLPFSPKEEKTKHKEHLKIDIESGYAEKESSENSTNVTSKEDISNEVKIENKSNPVSQTVTTPKQLHKSKCFRSHLYIEPIRSSGIPRKLESPRSIINKQSRVIQKKTTHKVLQTTPSVSKIEEHFPPLTVSTQLPTLTTSEVKDSSVTNIKLYSDVFKQKPNVPISPLIKTSVNNKLVSLKMMPASKKIFKTASSMEQSPIVNFVEQSSTASFLEQWPTTSSVEQSPIVSTVEQSPTVNTVEQSPAVSIVEQLPSTSSVELPTASTVEQSPTASTVEKSPTACSVKQSATTSSMGQLPTTKSVELFPTISRAAQQSSTTKSVKQPSTASSVEQSSAVSSMEQSSSVTSVKQTPTTSSLEKPLSVTFEHSTIVACKEKVTVHSSKDASIPDISNDLPTNSVNSIVEVSPCMSSTTTPLLTKSSSISSTYLSLAKTFKHTRSNSKINLSTNVRRSPDQRPNLTVAERLSATFLRNTNAPLQTEPASLSGIKESSNEEAKEETNYQTESTRQPKEETQHEGHFTKDVSTELYSKNLHSPLHKSPLVYSNNHFFNKEYAREILNLSNSTIVKQNRNRSFTNPSVCSGPKQDLMESSGTNLTTNDSHPKVAYKVLITDSDSSSSDSDVSNGKYCNEITKVIDSNQNKNTSPGISKNVLTDASSSDSSVNSSPVAKYKISNVRQTLRLDISQKLTEIMRKKVETKTGTKNSEQ